jgi:hypothetical protein
MGPAALAGPSVPASRSDARRAPQLPPAVGGRTGLGLPFRMVRFLRAKHATPEDQRSRPV